MWHPQPERATQEPRSTNSLESLRGKVTLAGEGTAACVKHAGASLCGCARVFTSGLLTHSSPTVGSMARESVLLATGADRASAPATVPIVMTSPGSPRLNL